MNFGYLLFVKTNSDIDYTKLAYALALSIKNTQKQGYDKVALVIDDKTELDRLKSPWVFDEVIEWGDQPGWDGRAWMHDLSPWEYTVCLDSDMLFFEDYSHWIEYFIESRELFIANKSFTYRNELVTDDYYRKTFTANSLPNLYSFYTFFKKESDTASIFFNLAKQITLNPEKFSNLYLSKHKPKIVGTDEAFALSAKILGIDNELMTETLFPRVVHLKPMIQNFPWPANRVSDHVGLYFDHSAQMKIGNFSQTNIVHYVEKDFITDEYIAILEEIAWNTQ